MTEKMDAHLHEPMWDVLCSVTQEEADATMEILKRAARGEDGPSMNSPDLQDEMKALHESMGGSKPSG
jgi:hypothetical protein